MDVKKKKQKKQKMKRLGELKFDEPKRNKDKKAWGKGSRRKTC